MVKEEGLRFNDGKTRHDLVPAFAQEQYARVLTKGAEKYAPRNWEKGMAWSKVLASMKRHILAFESGEDFDPETGLLHMAHVMCNAAFITEYYNIYPQGDDRQHSYLSQASIGLDIDEVLCDFVGGCIKRFPDMQERSIYWNDPHIIKNWDLIKDDEDFWLNLEPKVSHEDLSFEPKCYITSRTISPEVTKKWLNKHGFPDVPIHTVGHNESKVDIARDSGIDIFIDDRFENFVELNNAGICTYLFDAPHNRRYNVGYKRLMSLKELFA